MLQHGGRGSNRNRGGENLSPLWPLTLSTAVIVIVETVDLAAFIPSDDIDSSTRWRCCRALFKRVIVAGDDSMRSVAVGAPAFSLYTIDVLLSLVVWSVVVFVDEN